jgi:hypothetical protein
MVAAFATALSGWAVSAQAMPVGAVAQDEAGVSLVAQGCGPGFHRGPYGGCRPNFGPRRFAPRIVAPRRAFAPRCFIQRGPVGARRVCR